MNSHSQYRSRIPIFALLTANTISQVGNVMALVAIPWFVLATTGSAAKTGLTGFFTVLPVVLAGFFGGVVVDRLGHRRTSIIADILSGATVALIPFLYLTIGISLWQLLALVFLGALLDLPGSTARQSLMPELAEHADVRLERVNAAYQSVQQASFLVGPPIAGVLIALLGPTQVLWLNAASFAISAAIIAAWVPASLRVVENDTVPPAGYLTDLIEGWQFIRREPVIFSLTTANALGNFIGGPLFAVVLPVYASRVFGNAVNLGLMLGGAAAGTLGGALLYGLVGHRVSRRWLYASCWLTGAVPFWVLAGTPPLIIAITALVVLGLTDGPINPLMYTLSQERTPTRLRGRVFGARIALANIATPLGMLAAGLLIEWIGLGPTLLTMAIAQTAVALYVFAGRGFQELDAPVSAASSGIPERPGTQLILKPEWWLLGIALLLVGTGLGAIAVLDNAQEISIGVMLAATCVLLGWVFGGAALRPQGSWRLGGGIAGALYLLAGIIVAGIVVLPVSDMTAPEVVPAVDHYSAVILIVLLWPVVATRLVGGRARPE